MYIDYFCFDFSLLRLLITTSAHTHTHVHTCTHTLQITYLVTSNIVILFYF